MNLISRYLKNKNLRPIITFGLVAVASAVFELTVYTIFFAVFGVDKVLASPMAQVLSLIFNFTLNKIFTFNKGKSFKISESLGYLLIWTINLSITTLFMYFIVNHTSIFPTIGRFIAMVVMFFFNYFSLKYFVFTDRSEKFFSLNLWVSAKFAIVTMVFSFALLFITNGEPYVRSDGFCYYHISKSIIDENNFISQNEPEYWDYMGHVKETYRGDYISVCNPGTAVAILPGMIIANFFKGDQSINNNYFMAYNGHTIQEGLSILITATIFGILSIVLIYKILKELKFSEKIAVASTAFTFIASYLVWYLFLNPSFTHVYEVFGITFALYYLIKFQKNQKVFRYIFLTGLGGGFAVIVRPVLAPFVLAIALYLLYLAFGKKISQFWKSLKFENFKPLIFYILGGLPAAIILSTYNYISYGKILTTGYESVRGETFAFTQFNFFNVLFAPTRGWFVYSPLFILSIIGLILLYKRNKLISLLSLITIFSSALIYGFWGAWWGGGSYGSRFMIFALPFCAIGLAYFVVYIQNNFRKSILSITYSLIFLLTLYTFSISTIYRFTPIQDNSYTPIYFLEKQSEYLRNDGSLLEYLKNLPDRVQGGSGIFAIITGRSDHVMKIIHGGNEIKFEIFSPPISNQPFPDQIEFYMTYRGVVYRGLFLDMKNAENLRLKCGNECMSFSLNIYMESTEIYPGKLEVAQFTGIQLPELGANIYLENGHNMQFRGDMIGFDEKMPRFRLK